MNIKKESIKAFWKGFCSIFDIFGTSVYEIEYKTIEDDIEALGKDFEKVIGKWEK